MDGDNGGPRWENLDPTDLIWETRAIIAQARELLAEIERTDEALEAELHAARRAVAASRFARAIRSGGG